MTGTVNVHRPVEVVMTSITPFYACSVDGEPWPCSYAAQTERPA